MIRNEEKENKKEFDKWNKYDHITFNTKLWKHTNKILETIQEEKIPK